MQCVAVCRVLDSRGALAGILLPAKCPNQDTSGGERPLDGLQNIFVRFFILDFLFLSVLETFFQLALYFSLQMHPFSQFFGGVVDQ